MADVENDLECLYQRLSAGTLKRSVTRHNHSQCLHCFSVRRSTTFPWTMV